MSTELAALERLPADDAPDGAIVDNALFRPCDPAYSDTSLCYPGSSTEIWV
jgi:hypothetical protein